MENDNLENTQIFNTSDNNLFKKLSTNLSDLFNNSNNLQFLIIIDFYNIDSNLDNFSSLFEEIMEILKDIIPYDKSVIYLIFIKNALIEKLTNIFTNNIKDDKNKIFYRYKELLLKTENIFFEDKMSDTQFTLAYFMAYDLFVYIFNNSVNNSSWIKINDSKLSQKLKFSEFGFMRVTMNYLLKDKKRKYEEIHGKSKLSSLFNDKENFTKNEIQINKNETNSFSHNNFNKIILSNHFQNILVKIQNYFSNSPPKSFSVIKNIIFNFAEQNIYYYVQNFNFKDDKIHDLAFLLFSELLNKDAIVNYKLKELINENKITSLDEIDNLLSFGINKIENMENTPLKQSENEKQSKKNNNNKSNFPISILQNSEAEYKNLVVNCSAICNFTKNTIIKLLSSLDITKMDKLPSNPHKYKNLIYSYVNNQELFKIVKMILNLDYQYVANLIADGIIIEFIQKNLIIFINEKKNILQYNRNRERKVSTIFNKCLIL